MFTPLNIEKAIIAANIAWTFLRGPLTKLAVSLLSSILYSVAVKAGADEVKDHLERHYGKQHKDRS